MIFKALFSEIINCDGKFIMVIKKQIDICRRFNNNSENDLYESLVVNDKRQKF